MKSSETTSVAALELGPSKILKHVYIGSQHDAKMKSTLQKLQITHILNCTPPKTVDPIAGCPNYFEKEKNMFVYKRIPVFDNAGENLLDYMDAAIDFIDCAKHYGSVLVHCKKGVSRSASFVIAYLMKVNEFSLAEALSYVQSQRPIAMPNQTFMSQLQAFEGSLNSSLKEKNNSLNEWDIVRQDGPMTGPSGPTNPVPDVDTNVSSELISTAVMAQNGQLGSGDSTSNVSTSRKREAGESNCAEEITPPKRQKI